MSFVPRRFRREESLDRTERHYQEARLKQENDKAATYFNRLAAARHRDLQRNSRFDSARRSIVASFQPKSGGTYLHNRMLELGYQEFWWCYPNCVCHSYCYVTECALQLYLQGGAACHSHFRPEPAILEVLKRCGVDKIWIHLRNPVECTISAYHHFRGEGHGTGAVGAERRRAALAAAKRYIFLRPSDKAKFIRDHLDWHIEWAVQWLRYDRQNPGAVVLSYHRELTDPQRMLDRVFREFGVETPGRITPAPTSHDRFRPNPLRDWRQELDAATQRFVERRLKESLAQFPAFERLWT